MSSPDSSAAGRVRVLADRPPRPDGEFVLYWMTAARRLRWNHALERAAALARELARPLVVLEALSCDYPWASERHHAFVLQGMADTARRAAGRPLLYHPYVEPEPGAGRGLLAALSRHACAVVADDAPHFLYPRLLGAAARRVDCRLEAVDSAGLLPIRAAPRALPTAYAFRRFAQAHLKRHLLAPPAADPLAGRGLPRPRPLPEEIVRRWPGAGEALLAARPEALARLPVDHGVMPVAALPGGATAAERLLDEFLERRLARYAEERSHPDAEAASGLSPYLHFGHLGVHEIVARLAERERWSVETLPEGGRGGRSGWWGTSASAEAFLDQLVIWRELGQHTCALRPDDHDRWESLPAWARATLERHAGDERPYLYEVDELAAAATHDELWNAAQRQLVAEGRIHNYMRMLWGKKVLEWSPDPRAALANLLALNDRWALDGRDPNSECGIFWCLGRHDRPWAPERPVFGLVRYMSSAAARRKLRLSGWLARWSSADTEVENRISSAPWPRRAPRPDRR
jgi:deoxyribodipyrimidine photo-lyase